MENSQIDLVEENAKFPRLKPSKDEVLEYLNNIQSTYTYKGKSVYKDGNKLGRREMLKIRRKLKTRTFGIRYGVTETPPTNPSIEKANELFEKMWSK